jgi:GntR family transcriptional regulator
MAVSKWRTIADDLVKKIEAGEIARGAQLPTEIELQDEYDASRNTVRDAIKWLIQRQLVETHAGRGTFVSRKITPFAVELSPGQGMGPGGGEGSAYVASAQIQNRRPSMSDPRVEIRKADRLVARQLRIEEGARVVSRSQERFIDDDPWSLQTSFYPMQFVNRGAEHEAVFFDLPENASVTLIELSRTAFATTGEPIRFTVTVYPADRNMLYYNIGEVPEAHLKVPGPA